MNYLGAVCLLSLVLPSLTQTTNNPTGIHVKCFPNSSIHIQKPPYAASVFAHNSKGKCVSKFATYDPTLAVITGCEKDIQVLVTFSNYVFGGADVLGGTLTETHVLNCKEIPIEGVVMETKVNYSSALAVHEKSEYPYVDVRSAIFEDASETTLAGTVGIGDPVFLTIYTNMDFILKPEACWAYGGQVVNESAPKTKLIEQGCSVDISLCKDFQKGNATTGSKINMVLKGFRFYGSDFITIRCSLRMCKGNEADNCVFACGSRKRRADNALSEDQTEVMASVTRSLKVVDENSWLSSASKQETRYLWTILPLLGLLVILSKLNTLTY